MEWQQWQLSSTMAMFVETSFLRPITIPGYISTSRNDDLDSSGHVHVQSKLSVSMESFVIICEFEPLVSMARILSYIINYMNPL
jgi:hypothetical protein